MFIVEVFVEPTVELEILHVGEMGAQECPLLVGGSVFIKAEILYVPLYRLQLVLKMGFMVGPGFLVGPLDLHGHRRVGHGWDGPVDRGVNGGVNWTVDDLIGTRKIER
jgi:hypothetical protein